MFVLKIRQVGALASWRVDELTGMSVGENVSNIQTELNLENLCGLSILTKTSQRQCEILSSSPTTALRELAYFKLLSKLFKANMGFCTQLLHLYRAIYYLLFTGSG